MRRSTRLPSTQRFHRCRSFEKTVEISQLQAVEKIVETRETQMIQSIQTSESLKPDDPDAEIKFLVEETELVVSSSIQTETVLSMNWEDGTA